MARRRLEGLERVEILGIDHGVKWFVAAAYDLAGRDEPGDAAGDAPALRLAPDFTNLVKPAVAPEDDLAWFATQELPDRIRGVDGG